MDENEKKARELIAEAQKKNKKGFFSFGLGWVLLKPIYWTVK